MKKRISIIVVIVLVALAALMLSSCERSASKAPIATPTLNLPVTTQAQPVIVAEDVSDKATKEAAEAETEEETVEVIEEEPTEEPTVAPTPEPEIPEITRPETYTLQQGEWPICIARRFDLDLGTFFSQNGLSMASKPVTGTVLKIPADGNWSVATYGERALMSHPTSYTVKSGDTINTVACHFGDVSPEQIAAKNNLEAPFTLTAGQELQIP